MRSMIGLLVASVAITTGSGVFGAPTAVLAQSAVRTYKVPRTADGQPDLSGMWQALTTANWDLEDHGAAPAPYPQLVGVYLAKPPGLSVVEGGTIPYKTEALARRKSNFDARLKYEPIITRFEDSTGDPEAKCFGVTPPRGTYLPFPFQIVQNRQVVVIAYEFAGTPRVVHLGAVNELEFSGTETWIGQSKGRFEGDSLVVETQGFSGDPWLDRSGNFMSRAAKVTERYTPTSPYHLMYEATIDDPAVFTRPWKLRMPLYRRVEANAQLLEFQCIPFAEEFMYHTLVKPPAR